MRAGRGVAVSTILLGLAGCSGGEPPAPSPTVAPAAEPPARDAEPERVVPQVRPSHISDLAWLDADTLLVAHGADVYRWAPETGHVLEVEAPSQSSSPFEVTRAGFLHGASVWRTRTRAWEQLPPGLDPWDVRLSPSFDHVAFVDEAHGDRALVVRDLRAAREERVPIGLVTLAFSPDGVRLATCGEQGVELRDVDTLAWRAGWRGRSSRCAWGPADGLIVSVSDDEVVLLEASTLQPIGTPMPVHARAVGIARDGAHVALGVQGERAGLSIREVATGRELAFVEGIAPTSVAIEGERVAWAEGSWSSRTRGGVVDLAGHEVLAPREGFEASHLGPGGDLALLEGGVVVVRAPDGATHRWDGPIDVRIAVERERVRVVAGPDPFFVGGVVGWGGEVPMLAPTRAATLTLPDLAGHVFGACPTMHEDFTSPDAAHPIWTSDAWIVPGCVGRADGATFTREGFEPLAAGAGRIVTTSADRMQVVGLDGLPIATLRLEPNERPVCATAGCPAPIALSPDGALVAMARGSDLRVFDATTGARLGRTRVSERTRQLVFLDAPAGGNARVVQAGFDGTRVLASLPTLRVLARWSSPPSQRNPLRVLDAGLLDVTLERWSLRDRDGTELATRPSGIEPSHVFARGTLVVAEVDGSTQVYDGTSLAPIATIETALRGVGPSELYTCADDVVVRHVRVGDGLEAHATTAPCGEVVWITEGWLLVTRGTARTLVDPRNRSATLVLALDEDRLRVALLDARGLHGDPIALIAHGDTLRVPERVGDLGAWAE